jgi:hypothetical protein
MIICTKNYLKLTIIYYQSLIRKGEIIMRIVLCTDDTCVPPKCPTVDVQGDTVTIGEKENVCTLTKQQFDIMKEKIKNNEI